MPSAFSSLILLLGFATELAGVIDVLSALLERHSFENNLDWEHAVLSATFLPSLPGTVVVIVGSWFDRSRLPLARTRVRGLLCWVTSGISIWLLNSIGNVHTWTYSFIFPAFATFVSGAILLSN
jgi:hypothetical protein